MLTTFSLVLLFFNLIGLLSSEQNVSLNKKEKVDICDKLCKCYSLMMKCEGTNISKIPEIRPNYIMKLYLRDNQIRKIKQKDFRKLYFLELLSLEGNNISSIDEMTFNHQYKLIILNLANNRIKYLSPNLFRRLVFLKKLILNKNRLSNIDGALSYLANVNVLKLADNKIERISNQTFHGNSLVRILDLSNNRINHIYKYAFNRMTYLQSLFLANNPITQLDVNFDNNFYLSQLDITKCHLNRILKNTPNQIKDFRMSENKVTLISDSDFNEPSAIQVLLLNDNLIDTLSENAFDYMPLLRDLYLSKNRLKELPDSVPQSLERYFISHNKISQIDNGSLLKQKYLQILVLSNNMIDYINHKALRNLRMLVSLDLSFNRIKYLQNSIFSYLYSLQRLDLSNNPLNQLGNECFFGLSSLHILRMSSVEGSKAINVNSFSYLNKLLYLDVSNNTFVAHRLIDKPQSGNYLHSVRDLNIMDNKLRTLPINLKHNMPNLRYVKMTRNRWLCDENIIWISKWIQTRQVNFFERENLLCFRPSRLKNRPITSVTKQDTMHKHRNRNFKKWQEILYRRINSK